MSGLQEVVLSVFDLDRIARPMIEVGGYVRIPLADAPHEQFAAWHAPAECTRIEQALLTPPEGDDHRGSLRLVKFHGVDQRVMRSSQRTWDTGGIFDIDVFSADVDQVYRGLQRHGWTAFGEPVDYSEAVFSVRQVVAVGPDGLMVAIIQRYKPPVEGLPASGAFSPIFNSTQMVADYQASARFYLETLGWTLSMEFPIEDVAEPGADVLGLPLPMAKDARRFIGMFCPPGGDRGAVELIENKSMSGRAFGDHCVAPNVGILALRIPVEDAGGYAAQIVARGGVLYAPPTSLVIEPYGRVTSFAVRSPEGAIVEFYSA